MPGNMVKRDNDLSTTASPVKEMLDLSLFTVFDASTSRTRDKNFITVGKNYIYLSLKIACELIGKNVELMLNPKGNIIVIRETGEDGLPVRGAKGKDGNIKAGTINCRSFRNKLIELGVKKLPVRYYAKFDPELNAWVAKARDKNG